MVVTITIYRHHHHHHRFYHHHHYLNHHYHNQILSQILINVKQTLQSEHSIDCNDSNFHFVFIFHVEIYNKTYNKCINLFTSVLS